MVKKKKGDAGLAAGILAGAGEGMGDMDAMPEGTDWPGYNEAAGEAFTAIRSGNRDDFIAAMRSMAEIAKGY